MEKIYSKIKALRISKNLTQQQLADNLHVTKQAISKWENGKSIPDIPSIELLSSFFGVSVDYLINDNINTTVTETTTILQPKHLNKLNIILMCMVALSLATIIALSVTVGILLNKKSDTVSVNGFDITYLSDETNAIELTDTGITLHFNVYNSTDFTKTCPTSSFTINNTMMYIAYISMGNYPITAHEEIKLEVRIATITHEELGAINNHSVTVSYAGRPIATVKW